MRVKERAVDTGVISGTAALVVTAWWMAGVVHERNYLRAEAARPRPTTTATVTARPAAGRPTPQPGASSGMTHRPGTVVVAQGAPSPGPAGGEPDRPGPGLPSGPSPSPTAMSQPPAATSCGGRRPAAPLLRLASCVSIGKDDR